IKTFEQARQPSYDHSASHSVSLLSTEYLELQRTLRSRPSLNQYFQGKARFDYDPEGNILTVRMPSPVHDFFASLLANQITAFLDRVAERDDETGKFAASISNGTSSRILLRGSSFEGLPTTTQPMQRQPDAQFQHSDAAYPGVVLEISYSQNGKNLDKLAWDYILKSNGAIRVVIGIDLDYSGTHESSISIWRAVFLQEDGEELESLDVKREITHEVSLIRRQ
ncbi:hypothetical protein JX266_014423, partial [Neoarthrinium moseri]